MTADVRTLGVATSKADIDSGTISGVALSGTVAATTLSFSTSISGGASSKVGLYGTTPIDQRSGAAQATSLVGTASSTAVNTDMKAALIEVMNTLAALGAWKGSA